MKKKMIHQKDGDKFVVIGTKTSPDFAETFYRICAKKGIKPYQAMQMMVDAFVRYTDDRHNLSAEMEQLMSIFEHMDGWKDAFNLADASADRHIEEAIYLLSAKDRAGARAIIVHRPYFGNWSETANIQYIIERVIEVLLPERYWRLRDLAKEMECGSLLELLDRLVDAHTVEQLNAEFRKDFEDCNRSEYGRPIEYGARTKRKKHVGTEIYEQQTIHFTEDDRQQSNEEIKRSDMSAQEFLDDLDYSPHGAEW